MKDLIRLQHFTLDAQFDQFAIDIYSFAGYSCENREDSDQTTVFNFGYTFDQSL